MFENSDHFWSFPVISGHFRAYMPIMDTMPQFDLSETALEAPCGPLSVAFEFGIYTTFFFFGKLCKI